MTTVSVSIPEDLRRKMTEMDDVNWSAVARKSFEKKVNEVEIFKKIVSNSQLTEKDAKMIADKINSAVSKRFIDEARRRRKHTNSNVD